MEERGQRRPDFPGEIDTATQEHEGDNQLFYAASGENQEFDEGSPGPQPTELLSQEHFLEALTVQLDPVNVVDMIRRCQLGGRLYSDQTFTAEPQQIMPELKTNPEGDPID